MTALAALLMPHQAMSQKTTGDLIDIYLVCDVSVSEQINNHTPRYDSQFTLHIIQNDNNLIIVANFLDKEFEFYNFELKDESLLDSIVSDNSLYISKLRGVRVEWLENLHPGQIHGSETQSIDINRISGKAYFEIGHYSKLIGLNSTTRASGTCKLAPQGRSF